MVTTNESLRNQTVAKTVNLLRFDARLQAQVITRLRTILKKVKRDMLSADFANRTAFAQGRQIEFIASIEQTIRSGMDEITSFHTGQLMQIAELETGFANDIVNRKVEAELLTTQFSAEQLAAIVDDTLIETAPNSAWLQGQKDSLVQRFQSGLQEGVLLGETNQQLVNRTDDIFNITRRQLKTHVRTSVQRIANEARIQTWQQNSGVVKGVQQISTLDDRTSDICMAYSGKAWRLPDMIPIGHDLPWNGGPPRHFQCRSSTTPIVRSFEELGIDLPEPDAGRRAAKISDPENPSFSIGTDLPDDISFDEFLGNQSVPFQERLLGVERARLFREGQITTRDLIDFGGNSLTLEQLRIQNNIIDDL